MMAVAANTPPPPSGNARAPPAVSAHCSRWGGVVYRDVPGLILMGWVVQKAEFPVAEILECSLAESPSILLRRERCRSSLWSHSTIQYEHFRK